MTLGLLRALSAVICMPLSLAVVAAVDISQAPLKGASTDGQSTSAAFAAFMTPDNNQSYQATARTGDNVVIWGRINNDPKHSGMRADMFVLLKVENTFFMRTAAGGYQVWSGALDTLVPVRSNVTLGSSTAVDVFSGKLPVAGAVQVFLGYRLQGSNVVFFSSSPQQFDITATSSPVLVPAQLPAGTLPRSSYPSTTRTITPPWKMVTENGSFVNNDSVTGFNNNSISDDGNRIVFSSWSTHGFGLATRNCAFDWIYMKDFSNNKLSIVAYDLAGKILCGYESSPGISGNGNYLFYRGVQRPYSHSVTSLSGIWRTAIGFGGYMPVNAKGLEFSFEQNGSLNYGTVIRGDAVRFMPDRDGNSVVFSMRNLENVSEVPKQANATLFDHAILRQDKGARTVGNQNYALPHGMTSGNLNISNLYFDVSSNGTVVVYNEAINSGAVTFRAWDMLARADLGRLFADEAVKQPTVNPLVCGISSDGRYLLVDHTYSLPLDPARPTTAYTKFATQGRLSRYDRLKKEFLFVAVSEEETRSMDAECDYFTNDGNPRQLSNDGNRVFWDSGGYFFIRDIAAEKTVKIKQPAVIHQWGISGDGRYIVFESGTSPGGTIYKNQYGGTVNQIYRYGPVEAADFGSSFSLRTFEEKLVAR